MDGGDAIASCEGLTPPELSIFSLLRAGRERESALEMVYALFPCLLNWILENSALNHYIPVRREQALRGSMASVCSLNPFMTLGAWPCRVDSSMEGGLWWSILW